MNTLNVEFGVPADQAIVHAVEEYGPKLMETEGEKVVAFLEWYRDFFGT